MVSHSSGMVTRKKVATRPAPSISAASNRSLGIEDMAALNSTR